MTRGSVLLCALLLGPAAVVHGHEGKIHVVGTVTSVTAERLVVRDAENHDIAIRVDGATSFARGTSPAKVADLAVGDRVLVDVTGTGDDLTATAVRIGVRRSETPDGGTAGHQHQH